MPEIDFVRTVFPAPLSPTSAITSPASARRFARVSALTAPKRFAASFTSSRCSLTILDPPQAWAEAGGAPERPAGSALSLLDPELGAHRRECARADVAPVQESVGDYRLLDVGRRHWHRGLQLGRGGLARSIRDRRVGGRSRALDERDRDRAGRVGLLLDRLVDGHALLAGEDVLDARERRVLTGQ